MVPAWLWSNISPMAAAAPKLASIWNTPGSWEPKRLSDMAPLMRSRRLSQARCPSSNLAHSPTTHVRLQPGPPPPFARRCSSERRAAAASSGVDLGVTSSPG